jgi:2'-5' RNA ligase
MGATVSQTGDMESERPRVVSLELLLDPTIETQIRCEWQALADAGLSSLAVHTSPSNRPHITLLARTSIPPIAREQLRAILSLPMPLVLGDPIVFGSGDRRVLARSVVPSAALLKVHESLHTIVRGNDGGNEKHGGIDDGADLPFTRPGLWTPHITLARRLRLDTLPQALRLLSEVGATADAAASSAVTLRRWDAASATVTDLLD